MPTKKKTRGLVRQGDVLLVPVDAMPADTAPAPKDARGLVLAEGESSGHSHQLFGSGAKLFQRAATGQLFARVGRAGAEVRVVGGGSGGVDRHTPISLAPGAYEIRIQRSWSSASASRQVAD